MRYRWVTSAMYGEWRTTREEALKDAAAAGLAKRSREGSALTLLDHVAIERESWIIRRLPRRTN